MSPRADLLRPSQVTTGVLIDEFHRIFSMDSGASLTVGALCSRLSRTRRVDPATREVEEIVNDSSS